MRRVGFMFFLNDTATTEIYTLSLHDALPISPRGPGGDGRRGMRHERARRGSRRAELPALPPPGDGRGAPADRKSTRLNSRHANISSAVFCLKKKTIVNSAGPPDRRLLYHSAC